ncbi:RNA-directed DNA polymerase, eukaryota, reverse transcriptase zinc-binding domain protein [Tanacetum coccineum]
MLNSWTTMSLNPISNQLPHHAICFKSRLQHLKSDIKQWRHNLKESESLATEELRKKIDYLDIKAETAFLTQDKIIARTHNIKALADLEHGKIMDLNQKAKIRWALEGDENSLFFHEIINSRINHAVWDGSEKSSGPDEFTFKFLKKHLDLIQNDVFAFVKDFETSSFIPRGCNSSFIPPVPKVDDLLVIGDFRPISLISVAILEATNNNIFHGVKVGKDKINISHLQFADDALILGDWSLTNAKNLSRILTCFHLASGLKGRNVDEDKISWIAWNKVASPRKNGGLGIGSLMESNQSLLAKWQWRFRMEENAIWCKVIRFIHGPTGGMLNPFDLKQSLGTWSQIVKLKDDLNSIGINLPLLFKKKIGDGMSTRFWHDNRLGGNTLREAFLLLYQLETKKDCYVFEQHGSVVQNSHTSHGSVQVLGPISQPIISRINDGLVTPWAWGRRPRSLAEILELTDLQNLLTNLHLSMDQDLWEFTQDTTRIFSVNSMRKTISNTSVDPTSQQTRWNKLLPFKVNILAWRIAKKRLPTRANLDKRGIDLDCATMTSKQKAIFWFHAQLPNPCERHFYLVDAFKFSSK